MNSYLYQKMVEEKLNKICEILIGVLEAQNTIVGFLKHVQAKADVAPTDFNKQL